MQVIKNISIQQIREVKKQQDPFFNIALIRIGIGVALAIITAVVIPGIIILPIGLVAGGIAAAYMSRSKK